MIATTHSAVTITVLRGGYSSAVHHAQACLVLCAGDLENEKAGRLQDSHPTS